MVIPEDFHGSLSTVGGRSGNNIQLHPVEKEETSLESGTAEGITEEQSYEESKQYAGILLSEKDSEMGMIELPSPINELR